MKKELIVIGAGGHAKVVLDTIKNQGIYSVKGFCVDDVPVGQKVLGYTVIDNAQISEIGEDRSVFFIVAIGDNNARKIFFENALKKYTPAIIIHSSAVIGSNVVIGDGSVVLANVVINADAKIGINTIVNTGVIIDHDSQIGNHSHLSLGTVVASKLKISDGYLSGIGSKIQSSL